jgi:hypothetical protein
MGDDIAPTHPIAYLDGVSITRSGGRILYADCRSIGGRAVLGFSIREYTLPEPIRITPIP